MPCLLLKQTLLNSIWIKHVHKLRFNQYKMICGTCVSHPNFSNSLHYLCCPGINTPPDAFSSRKTTRTNTDIVILITLFFVTDRPYVLSFFKSQSRVSLWRALVQNRSRLTFTLVLSNAFTANMFYRRCKLIVDY